MPWPLLASRAIARPMRSRATFWGIWGLVWGRAVFGTWGLARRLGWGRSCNQFEPKLYLPDPADDSPRRENTTTLSL